MRMRSAAFTAHTVLALSIVGFRWTARPAYPCSRRTRSVPPSPTFPRPPNRCCAPKRPAHQSRLRARRHARTGTTKGQREACAIAAHLLAMPRNDAIDKTRACDRTRNKFPAVCAGRASSTPPPSAPCWSLDPSRPTTRASSRTPSTRSVDVCGAPGRTIPLARARPGRPASPARPAEERRQDTLPRCFRRIPSSEPRDVGTTDPVVYAEHGT